MLWALPKNVGEVDPLAIRKLIHGMGGASRSQSALHMHVLVCICSNVRQFQGIIDMMGS